MYNELVNIIKCDRVSEEDKDYAQLLARQLRDCLGGGNSLKKEVTYFIENMEEKYGEIPKATLEQQLIDLKNDYEEYKKKPIKCIDKLDGFHWVNVNDKICADYELKIKNLENEIAQYNKGV